MLHRRTLFVPMDKSKMVEFASDIFPELEEQLLFVKIESYAVIQNSAASIEIIY